MKIVQKIVVAFVFILWSANVAAFDVEGISYEVLSESERTACVARQMVPDQLVGDIKILSKVGRQAHARLIYPEWEETACQMK